METLIWIGVIAAFMLACWWLHHSMACLLAGRTNSRIWVIHCDEARTAAFAALNTNQGNHKPQITDCSLWPANQRCGRSCLKHIPSLPAVGPDRAMASK
jgi:hypothetical protein